MRFTFLAAACSIALPLTWEAAHSGSLASSATLSIEPGSVAVRPGEAAQFAVYLRDYQPASPSHPIQSFGLSVEASDAALTSANADFSRFSFSLNPALAGILSMAFDSDLSDDGRVDYGVDFPAEAGIFSSMGDTLLGQLSVVAPGAEDVYGIALNVDSQMPIIGGGTFLSIDDGSAFGLLLPGDGALAVVGSQLVVVPEPAAAVLAVLVLGGVITYKWQLKIRAPGGRKVERWLCAGIVTSLPAKAKYMNS